MLISVAKGIKARKKDIIYKKDKRGIELVGLERGKTMKEHVDVEFSGERALFKEVGSKIIGCCFFDGESPLKESHYLRIEKSVFSWRYPLWYSDNVTCLNTTFLEGARAGVWYTNYAHFEDCSFLAPKCIRKCHDLTLYNVQFLNAVETLWWSKKIKAKNIVVKGDYFALESSNLLIEDLDLVGQYCFDGCKNVILRHSTLKTKDAFWNCKNIRVEDSYIEGEYFGWNSKNITLVRCVIKSHQGFCYMKNITLIDCTLIDSDLTFEYCKNINATINSNVISIKNPTSGVIRLKGYEELITDDCNVKKTKIEII